MTSNSGKNTPASRPERGSKASAGKSPEWADGLRQIYDSVVEEPLPDSFKDLLAQLDDKA